MTQLVCLHFLVMFRLFFCNIHSAWRAKGLRVSSVCLAIMARRIGDCSACNAGWAVLCFSPRLTRVGGWRAGGGAASPVRKAAGAGAGPTTRGSFPPAKRRTHPNSAARGRGAGAGGGGNRAVWGSLTERSPFRKPHTSPPPPPSQAV